MYRGYKISHRGYCWVVTSPSGKVWTEDTLDDAYNAIDEDIVNE